MSPYQYFTLAGPAPIYFNMNLLYHCGFDLHCYWFRMLSFHVLMYKWTSLEKRVFIGLPIFNWDDSTTDFEEFPTCFRQALYLLCELKISLPKLYLISWQSLSCIHIFNLGILSQNLLSNQRSHLFPCINVCIIPDLIIVIVLSLDFFLCCVSY